MNRGLKKPPVHLWFILFIYGLFYYVVSHLQCVGMILSAGRRLMD